MTPGSPISKYAEPIGRTKTGDRLREIYEALRVRTVIVGPGLRVRYTPTGTVIELEKQPRVSEGGEGRDTWA